jgi:hypothetical protein
MQSFVFVDAETLWFPVVAKAVSEVLARQGSLTGLTCSGARS